MAKCVCARNSMQFSVLVSTITGFTQKTNIRFEKPINDLLDYFGVLSNYSFRNYLIHNSIEWLPWLSHVKFHQPSQGWTSLASQCMARLGLAWPGCGHHMFRTFSNCFVSDKDAENKTNSSTILRTVSTVGVERTPRRQERPRRVSELAQPLA